MALLLFSSGIFNCRQEGNIIVANHLCITRFLGYYSKSLFAFKCMFISPFLKKSFFYRSILNSRIRKSLAFKSPYFFLIIITHMIAFGS